MNDALIICEDSGVQRQIEARLGDDYAVEPATRCPVFPEAADTTWRLVFIDMTLLPADADELRQAIRQLRRHNPYVRVVALAPREHLRRAAATLRQGADDFLIYPIDDAELDLVLEALNREQNKHLELEYLRDQFWQTDWRDTVYTVNPAMQQVLKQVRSVAPTIATVLLLGQTGTGKGWLARLIHRHSHRSEEAFVAVHCGAIPDTLIESELFGHEKGAYTGADRRKIGKFELARNGTIFLDEIGTITPAAQIKLLQVLQDGTFSRLGGEEILSTNARIIAATNADLVEMARQGTFRRDLLYRLNIFPLQLPTLTQRKDDLPHLIEYFLERLNRKYGKAVKGLMPGVIDALQDYDWPGNLRELENVIERAVILATGDVLTPESFPETMIINSKILQAMGEDQSMPLSAARQIAIDEFECIYLEKLLKKHHGKINDSAREAHITTRQLSRLVTKHGLDKKTYRR